MNMDRMTEDEIMIAELERIIRAEEAKPDGERDAQLIDDCIKEMAEIKGVRAEYSQEEVAEITEKLIRDTEKEKAKRKKLVRRVAGIAAAVVLSIGTISCAVKPLIVNWIASIVRMPLNTHIIENEKTITNRNFATKYMNIEDLLRNENIEVYYPTVLPDDVFITSIRILEEDNEIWFFFNDSDMEYMIQPLNSLNSIEYPYNEIISVNGIDFYIYYSNEVYIAKGYDKTRLYIIKTSSYLDLTTIIENVKKVYE